MSGGRGFSNKTMPGSVSSLVNGLWHGHDQRGTMTCRQAQDTLSDYLEGSLSVPVAAQVAAHLEGCADCATESRQLASMMRVIREQVGRCEPVLDIWAELAPKVAAVVAEERLGYLDRLRLRSGRFWNNVAAGAILFTHALAMNTEARMRKHLLMDPFHLAHGEEA